MPFDPNDADTKAAIDAAIAQARESFDAEMSGLKAKNNELVAKVRAASGVKPEDLAAAEGRAERAEADLAAANKSLANLTKERDGLAKNLEGETGFTRKLLIENGLRAELAANGVTNAVHQKAAMAMLSGQVEVISEGADRVAKVGDKGLSDFVKGWAAGDEGKHFISAAMNGGGDAGGSGSAKGGAKTVSRTAFDAMTPADKMTFSKEGGTITDAAA